MKEMTIFWLVSMIVLFIVEAATVNLVTIWFAVGALAALISSLAGGPLWLQIVLFIVFTVVTLIPTRTLAKKYGVCDTTIRQIIEGVTYKDTN